LKLEQWQQKDSERILDESCPRHVSLEIVDPPWNDRLPKKTHSNDAQRGRAHKFPIATSQPCYG
jgi:hypothetical protein